VTRVKAVHFGGGNIGRGFIGLLLSQAGYRVVFVDVNSRLVEELNRRGQYTVELADASAERLQVDGVSAIDGNDREQVAQAVAEADLVTTAVGVNVLPHIAGSIAQGIARRLPGAAAEAGGPADVLPIIACENAIGASTRLKELVGEQLPPALLEEALRHTAFPDAAVDRIVPVQQHDDDPLKVVVEPFYEWVVDRSALPAGVPEIAGVHYVDRLQPYIERKLFTVNTGHCVAAYHGYLRGCKTIQEALAHPAVYAEVVGALEETSAALRGLYGFDRAQHEAYIRRILDRFRNPFLSDDVVRVGRSPIRKISPNDRLIRPALAAQSFGAATPFLANAVAAALLFDYPEDTEAAELQRSLRERGVSATVRHYAGVSEDDSLHGLIVSGYEALKREVNAR